MQEPGDMSRGVGGDHFRKGPRMGQEPRVQETGRGQESGCVRGQVPGMVHGRLGGDRSLGWCKSLG